MKSFAYPLILLISFALFAGCKKKCTVPADDVNTGDIVPDSYVLEVSSGARHVVRSEGVGDSYKVSFDKGQTYNDVDFNNYFLINYPVTVTCNSQLTRKVEIDYFKHTVKYTIEVLSCADCEDVYNPENFVLIPKFPDDFIVSWAVTYTEQKVAE